MSPSPHPAARSTSRRRSALRLPLVAGLSLALAIPVLAACQDESGPARSSTSSGKSSSQSSDKPSDSGSTKGTEVNGGAAGWHIIVSAPGWTNTKRDTGGVNELVSDDGCQFVTTQNLLNGQLSTDREDTETHAASEQQKFSQGVTHVSFKPAQDDSTSVKDASGNAIETKRLDWTYTGKDGKEYQATEFIRAFSTIKRPTMLTATLICPKDKYSTAVLDDLMKDTTVTDPGPADMDEGASGDGTGKDSNSVGPAASTQRRTTGLEKEPMPSTSTSTR